MTSRRSLLSRRSAGTIAALLLAILPLSATARVSRGHTSVASGGAVARPLPEPAKESLRRRLTESARGTYISEMLAERDSSFARWPDRRGDPLAVWIQPESNVDGWSHEYVQDVRTAFKEWDALHLPVRFTFTADSASADVHVSFIDHFTEEISGRTKWARDDDWWITEANIVLAVYHREGPMLDDDAMHAMSLHEIGHLLGLDHTADSTSIMASKVRVRSLSRADRATVRLLYTMPAGAVR